MGVAAFRKLANPMSTSVPIDINKIVLSPKDSIQEAVRVLHEGHQRIALIVENAKLLGVLADGDIRRALLRGISFDSPVSGIMVRKPVVVDEGTPDDDVLRLMRRTTCYEVPVVNGEGCVVGLRKIDEILGRRDQESGIEAVVMAGGLGTRLLPLTQDTPKPLVPVGGKPILFSLLDRLRSAGFCYVQLALNYKADMIKSAIEQGGYDDWVGFIEEHDQLGTAGALSLMDRVPKRSFFVMNADLLTNVDFSAMHRYHRSEQNDITCAVREVTMEIPHGVVTLNGTGIESLEEKPVQTYFANAGIYVLEPDILEFMTPGAPRDMPDLINDAIFRGRRVESFPVHEYWIDVGNHDHLKRAKQDVESLGQ